MWTDLVSDLSDVETGLVNYCYHTLVRRFDQVADDLIVEVLDVLPLYAFPHVLLLLLLQHQLCSHTLHSVTVTTVLHSFRMI